MKLTKNKNLVSEILDREICIFNPINSQYINLNSTATRIWEILDTSRNINELIKILKLEYKDNGSLLESHVSLFIEDCIKNGILKYEK